ncbi:hypothetical protein N0V85_008980 [Neurospora sp. IMI 360204]|nr:hypothetical protein N0V85_008980 [Neurospora sp. IMI 360204]
MAALRTEDYPDWDPEIHDLPTASNDYFTFTHQARKSRYRHAFQQELNSNRPGGKVRIDWITEPPPAVTEIRIFDCAEICRDQADRFNLKYVMIRQGPHITRNINTNGIPTMVMNTNTRRLVHKQQPADWHMTVLMGHNINELLISDHIYVTWDGNCDSHITLMMDPKNERKHLVGTEPAVALQYWGMVRGDVPPLKALQ